MSSTFPDPDDGHKPWCADPSLSRPSDECTCHITPEQQREVTRPEKPIGFYTESGAFMQLIPPRPLPDPVELSDEERLAATQHYMKTKYASLSDPWVSGSIMIDPSDAGATGVYNKMVHRETDGPDPLVPEP